MKYSSLLCCLVLFSAAYAQISTDALKNMSPQAQQQLIQQQLSGQKSGKLDVNELLKGKKDMLSDSVALNDSLLEPDSTEIDQVEKPSESDSLMIYERIVRGDTIHPDSMLKSLKIFGHKMFERSRPVTFTPSENVSIPPNYVINVDDEIIVLLWGRINEEYSLKVGRDGTVNIPRLGPVPVAGLPFSTMQSNLLSRIEQIEGVSASISVGTMRTIGVFIVGEVKTPGYYTISPLSNITNALFTAGGPSKNGSMRNIQLKRNRELVATVDLYDFLINGNDKSSLRLQAGDVIHVPVVSKMVAVTGNIRRSALYELKDNETLDKVIDLAGGISPAAWTNIIQIERFTMNHEQVVVDIDTVGDEIPQVPIADGDIIKIFPILEKSSNAVYLSGNVLRPGKYEFKDGMRLCGVIPDYKSLLPSTYLEYAIIIRQDPPRYLDRIVSFNLKEALDNPQSDKDVSLQPRDQIIVYKLDYFEPDRTVEIGGSVTTAGKYELLENMKIRDLVLQAGGLQENASSTRGELYRRNLDQNSDLISTVKIDFCVECAMNDDPKHNLELSRLDRVYIRQKLGWEDERRVTLIGQFAYPGTYVLFEGETLEKLVERAGGFSEDAYLKAAVFTRVSVKEIEKKHLQKYRFQMEKDLSGLSNEIASIEGVAEAQALLKQQTALQNRQLDSLASGRVVIDLTNQQSIADFVLEDGDTLLVPRNLNTVSVLGEVYNPSTFKISNDLRVVSQYIEAAGGVKSTSDLKHTYIIRANGAIVTNNRRSRIMNAGIEPGDAVVVPQRIKYTNPHKIFVETVDAIFKISSLLTAVITMIVLIQDN